MGLSAMHAACPQPAHTGRAHILHALNKISKAMDIPGFKWDPERKRYFKVLKTGQLPGSEYTISSLAEKSRNEQRHRAQEWASDAPLTKSPAAVFQYKRLSRKARKIYNGGQEELLTSMAVTNDGSLMTGSRNGVISFQGHRSAAGARSIVAIAPHQTNFAVVGVEDRLGSVVASGSARLVLGDEFVTSICSLDDKLLVGSDRGLTQIDLETKSNSKKLAHKSIGALARADPHSLLVGTKSGQIQLLDHRTAQSVATMSFPAAVTQIGSANGGKAVLAAGLQDTMQLFDLRKLGCSLFEFPDYKNWSTPQHGFAISPQTNISAVVLDNKEIGMWDLAGGSYLGYINYTTHLPRIEPPALAWTDQYLFIASMNSVRVTPAREVAASPARPAQLEHLHTTHAVLNN